MAWGFRKGTGINKKQGSPSSFRKATKHGDSEQLKISVSSEIDIRNLMPIKTRAAGIVIKVH